MSVRKLKIAMAQAVQPEFVSVDQAEILTGVSKWTWRAYAYKGTVESCKVGARLLIPITEIRRVIAEGRRPRVDGLAAGEPSAKGANRYPSVTGTDTAVQARA
jgi:hypothetical protein